MDESYRLKIEYVPLDKLKPYERNARKHGDTDIDAIAASIRRFGFKDPIGVWGKNIIVEGHGRLLAAKKLNLAEVPIIRLDDLTDEERRMYALAHNKTAELSAWDFDTMDTELEELGEMFDVEKLGFEPVLTKEEQREIVEDEVPEKPQARAKTGDMWKLGGHRLICGDSSDPAVLERLMGGVKGDMVFTDPPYGVAIGSKNKTLQSVQKAGQIAEDIEGDTMSESALYNMLKKVFINVRENCYPDASYYVTAPQGGSLGLMMMMMMKDAGLEVRHVLMWKKNSATFSIGRLDYDYQHEPIFYTWTESHHNYRGGEFRTTVWEVDKPRKCDLHPTMKPLKLIANALLDGTKEGMNVLDAFGGSGSTLIACEQLNRKCYMCEIDPHYCDVIIERWENLTGQKAERI